MSRKELRTCLSVLEEISSATRVQASLSKPHTLSLRPENADGLPKEPEVFHRQNIGAFLIGMGFGGVLYSDNNKKPPNNSIGNYLGPYILP